MSDNQNDKKKPGLLTVIGGIAALIPLFSLAFSAYQFIKIEGDRFRQQSFDNYHAVVSKIGDGDSSSGAVAAAFYELKNYPEYCELSLKIVSHYQTAWNNLPLQVEAIRLAKPVLENVCN